MWELFKDLLIRVQDRHVPVKRKEKDGKVRDPQITREVVNAVKRKKSSTYKAEDVGKVLNEYFASVFTQKVMEDSVEDANMLGHFEIKKEGVLGLLNSIRVDKSPGPDGIYPRLLAEAKEEFAGALTKIFVSTLATGGVPEVNMINEARAVDVVCKEFSKAFDKVPH
eukprot:g38860.t1